MIGGINPSSAKIVGLIRNSMRWADEISRDVSRGAAKDI
jgi:hypothetical protein